MVTHRNSSSLDGLFGGGVNYRPRRSRRDIRGYLDAAAERDKKRKSYHVPPSAHVRPNGEVEAPAEASDRTQVERSPSGAPEAAEGRRGRTLGSRARGAKQKAHYGPLQRLSGDAASVMTSTQPNHGS